MWCPSSVPMSNTSCAVATACAKAWGSSPWLLRWKLRAQTPSQQGLIIPRQRGHDNGIVTHWGQLPTRHPKQSPRFLRVKSAPDWSQKGQIPASTSFPSRAAGSLCYSSRAELPDPPGTPMEGGPRLYLMPTTSTACSLAASSRCLQDFRVVPKVMLGWAEGMESAVIPSSILQSKATLR